MNNETTDYLNKYTANVNQLYTLWHELESTGSTYYLRQALMGVSVIERTKVFFMGMLSVLPLVQDTFLSMCAKEHV